MMFSVQDSRTLTDSGKAPGKFGPFSDSIENQPGLSLAAVYEAVKRSGGYIWVFPSPGKGTAFKIYFPRIEAP